jgi:hypothetical protein
VLVLVTTANSEYAGRDAVRREYDVVMRSTAERALWARVSIVLLLLVATVMVTSRRT